MSLIAGQEEIEEREEREVWIWSGCLLLWDRTAAYLSLFACSHICSFCPGFSCCYSCNLSMFLLSWWIDFGASLRAQDLDTELDLLRSFIQLSAQTGSCLARIYLLNLLSREGIIFHDNRWQECEEFTLPVYLSRTKDNCGDEQVSVRLSGGISL